MSNCQLQSGFTFYAFPSRHLCKLTPTMYPRFLPFPFKYVALDRVKQDLLARVVLFSCDFSVWRFLLTETRELRRRVVLNIYIQTNVNLMSQTARCWYTLTAAATRLGSSLFPSALGGTSRSVRGSGWQTRHLQTFFWGGGTVLRTPQLDWNILFTGLFMVTDRLDWLGINGPNGFCQIRFFPQTWLGPILIEKKGKPSHRSHCYSEFHCAVSVVAAAGEKQLAWISPKITTMAVGIICNNNNNRRLSSTFWMSVFAVVWIWNVSEEGVCVMIGPCVNQ